MPISHISIHAPQWGATRRNGAKAAQPAGFQSTHPSGVRRFPLVVALGRELFQSTHPSGVRRGFQAECGALHISIHAPQWGATAQRMVPRLPTRFQSTHPSGVRRPDRSTSRDVRGHFNPRTPVGCDAGRHGRGVAQSISIHAPQWGATSTLGVVTMPVTFQSTHPSGVRPLVPLFNVLKPIFQSTHPSGVRLRAP